MGRSFVRAGMDPALSKKGRESEDKSRVKFPRRGNFTSHEKLPGRYTRLLTKLHREDTRRNPPTADRRRIGLGWLLERLSKIPHTKASPRL